MNSRLKKKKIGKWAFIKYKGDMCVYAACQSCGFTYSASSQFQELIDGEIRWSLPRPDLNKLYNYCPCCGRRMRPFNGTEVYKIDKYSFE